MKKAEFQAVINSSVNEYARKAVADLDAHPERSDLEKIAVLYKSSLIGSVEIVIDALQKTGVLNFDDLFFGVGKLVQAFSDAIAHRNIGSFFFQKVNKICGFLRGGSDFDFHNVILSARLPAARQHRCQEKVQA